MPDTVLPSVSDSITQVNTKLLGEAPAQAMATLFQTSGAASGIALQNAVHAQNNQQMLNNAVTVDGVNLLYTSATAASAQAATKLDAGFPGITARLNSLIVNPG